MPWHLRRWTPWQRRRVRSDGRRDIKSIPQSSARIAIPVYASDIASTSSAVAASTTAATASSLVDNGGSERHKPTGVNAPSQPRSCLHPLSQTRRDARTVNFGQMPRDR